jgi:RimJ/RimL family protein N-acetyltransferase
MMKEQYILDMVYSYLANNMNCTVEDLHGNNTIFTLHTPSSSPYVKILGVGNSNIITLSPDIYEAAKKQLVGKNRDELFESILIYGQSLYYIPDLVQMLPLPYDEEFQYELLVGDEIKKLKGVEGFDNSLAFDTTGYTPTCIVLYARKNDKVIGLAGASYVNDDLREVGIDVKSAYRGRGLATVLVRNLSVEILNRGKIPFYCASSTNIASQAVAIRSGYMPFWTDTFGTRS